VISLETRWCGERGKKELRRRRGIASRGATTGTRSRAASSSRPRSRSNSTAGARTCARSASISAARAGRSRGRGILRARSRGLRSHGHRWNWRLGLFSDFRWNHGRCGIRLRLELYELKSLYTFVAARASPAASGRTRPSAAFGMRALEIIRSNRIENQQNDEGMRKKGGGDTLPPPPPLSARNADRRSIALVYVASFGETPMTFTPAPRATSIAKITSEYFTFGSPLTKMIFSGRSL
jgi:hypothetical protein